MHGALPRSELVNNFFWFFPCCGRGTWSDVSNAVLISLSTPVRPSDCKLESDGHAGKNNEHTTRLIDTTRRTRRSSVRKPAHLAQTAVQRIRVQSARSIRASYVAYAASVSAATSAATQYVQRNSPRARALCIAPRSTCACVAQLCAALRHGVARPRPRACRAQRAATIIRALSR